MSNEPRFEVYPQRYHDGHRNREIAGKLTGDWGWRTRARNGKIVAVGGEGFTRDEDAIRAVGDAVYTTLAATGQPDLLSEIGTIPVVILRPDESRVTLAVAVAPSGD